MADMAQPQTQPVPDAALFQQLGIDDPRLIQLAQLMSRPTAPINDDKGDVIEMVSAERVEELESEVERLKGINQILFEQCEYMAAAVGACPQCWGEDPSAENAADEECPVRSCRTAHLSRNSCFLPSNGYEPCAAGSPPLRRRTRSIPPVE